MNRLDSKISADFSEYYDQEDDIYYVTFKTGEPSYALEVDDILIVEMGMFSNIPTGFRILNYKENKDKVKIKISFSKVEKLFEEAERIYRTSVNLREKELHQTLEKIFA